MANRPNQLSGQAKPHKSHPANKRSTRPNVYNAGSLLVSVRYCHADYQTEPAHQGVGQNLFAINR